MGKTKSLKHKLPMVLIYYEAYLNKTDARKREIVLKKNSSAKEKLFLQTELSLHSAAIV